MYPFSYLADWHWRVDFFVATILSTSVKVGILNRRTAASVVKVTLQEIAIKYRTN